MELTAFVFRSSGCWLNTSRILLGWRRVTYIYSLGRCQSISQNQFSFLLLCSHIYSLACSCCFCGNSTTEKSRSRVVNMYAPYMIMTLFLWGSDSLMAHGTLKMAHVPETGHFYQTQARFLAFSSRRGPVIGGSISIKWHKANLVSRITCCSNQPSKKVHDVIEVLRVIITWSYSKSNQIFSWYD